MFGWLSEPVTWGGFIVYALVVQFVINLIKAIAKSGK